MSFEWWEIKPQSTSEKGWNLDLDEAITVSSSKIKWIILTKDEFLEKLKDRLNISLIEVTPAKYFKWFRIFEIYDARNNFIWKVEIHFDNNKKVMKPRFIIIFSNFKRLWYWKSVYKQIQDRFLWYTLVSDASLIDRKTDDEQEKWDAVYLWESLCNEWIASDLWTWNFMFNNIKN
jgi:hypothetical protein